MSRFVPHHRPERGDVIQSSLPVSSIDWGGLGTAANWCNGHGGMIIPWAACGISVTDAGSSTFNFYVAPKKAAVERIWIVTMRSDTSVAVTCDVTAGGASAVTVSVPKERDARGGSFLFRESLSAKTNTAANAAIVIAPTGGDVTVEAIGCYEQTRKTLDANTDDYGVEIGTLRSRQPIVDLTYQSIGGVTDAYKNLDARRPAYFHWSTPAASELIITAGSGSPATLFPLSVPMAGAIATLGETTMDVTCAVLAKVDAGTGSIRFQSDDAGDSVTLSVTQTAYTQWTTDTLTINAEDLSVSDGRRGASWEGVAMDAWVSATNTLNIQAISIIRPATANPI